MSSTDPGEHPFLSNAGLVLKIHQDIPKGYAIGNGLFRQPRETLAEFLLSLGLRLGMDRTGRHVPETDAPHLLACAFKRVAHTEAVHDPLTDVGDRPAGRFARIRSGPTSSHDATVAVRSASGSGGRPDRASSRRTSRPSTLNRFIQSHTVWTLTPASPAIPARDSPSSITMATARSR